MKKKFCRIQRLVSRIDYQKTYQEGKKYVGQKLMIYFLLVPSCPSKLGITIGKKWGKAVKRSRFKRVVREGFRLVYPDLPKKFYFNVHPLPGFQKLSASETAFEFKCLIKKTCDNS